MAQLTNAPQYDSSGKVVSYYSGVDTGYNSSAPTSASTQQPATQPIAQAQPTPAPQIPTPVAPSPVSVNVNTQSPQTSPTTSETPYTVKSGDTLSGIAQQQGLSITDLLNLNPQYQANPNLIKPGQQVNLAKKYQDTFNQAKGTATPETSSEGRSAVQGLISDSQTQGQDLQQSFFDSYTAMNPVVKTMYDTLSKALSAPETKTTFVQEYQDLLSQQGIPALQTDLMNIKNIMDGTEDDIRTEISKSGGFATESQVAALTGARNKTLLKQANVLQDQLNLKEDYVNKIMELTGKDRDAAEKQVEQKLGILDKMNTLQEQITNNAKDNYQKVVDKVGYAGLASALQSDPTALTLAEKTLGLAKGSLSNSDFLNMSKSGDLQFVSGTENQPAGTFNKTTGVFTPYAGGGGTGGGSSPVANPAYSGIISTILGSGKFTKPQATAITNAINSGQDPFTVIKNQAKALLGQTEATKLNSYEAADSGMRNIKDALNAYYDAGGDTGLLSGTMEQVQNKLGQVKDPAKVQLATRIAVALQAYRNAISGTAYSNQEGQQIAAIFPGINKSHGLNDAIIAGRLQGDADTIDGIYSNVLGPAYAQLKNANLASTPGGQIELMKQKLAPGELLVARENIDGTRHYVSIKPEELWATDIKF